MSSEPEPPTRPFTDPRKVTSNGEPPAPGFENAPAPQPLVESGQHGAYWVLSDEERKRDWVRPLRTSYRHLKCYADTSMSTKIAETYARDPRFYGNTFCSYCKDHRPVSEFIWLDANGKPTTEAVGS